MRNAGFVRVPKFWVTPEEYAIIKAMALKHEGVLQRIRAAVVGSDYDPRPAKRLKAIATREDDDDIPDWQRERYQDGFNDWE